MASPFSRRMEQAGFPRLLKQLGDPDVLHHAGGVGDGASVTAIVFDANDGGEEVEAEEGFVRIIVKTVQVPLSLTVTIRDAWTIAGKWYTTTAVDAGHQGLRLVTVQRTEKDRLEKSSEAGH